MGSCNIKTKVKSKTFFYFKREEAGHSHIWTRQSQAPTEQKASCLTAGICPQSLGFAEGSGHLSGPASAAHKACLLGPSQLHFIAGAVSGWLSLARTSPQLLGSFPGLSLGSPALLHSDKHQLFSVVAIALKLAPPG